MPVEKTIHCRLASEQVEALDAHVAGLVKAGVSPQLASRSAAARMLISQSLGLDKEAIITSEVMLQAELRIQQITARTVERVLQSVPQAFAQEAKGFFAPTKKNGKKRKR